MNAAPLSQLDMGTTLRKSDYKQRLATAHARLNALHREARARGIPVILLFEGWDAGGKGGAIRRLVPAFDARAVRIHRIGAPTKTELRHHYLWRFWRRLPAAGEVAIFDRSWYGRVLVERVEGFATEAEWRRAYQELRDFEQQLVEHGIVLSKFWLHITPEEQERRFREREATPHKNYKLTEDDWRNRNRWDDYELAADAMIQETDRADRQWQIVPANDKRHARIQVIESVVDSMARQLGPDTDVTR